jgi:hypothetical protein
LSPEEQQQVGQFVGELSARLHIEHVKIAFVDVRTEQFQHNIVGGEAATRQGVNVKVFDNFAAAEQWLLAD